jgi:ubiquinone/menaquinone biosynthesis C-methylase UbiE
LQEVDDKQGLLWEMYRVLKRDGFLSVFPMHMGTERLTEIMGGVGLFRFRDRYNAPGHTTASEVINFEKGKSE